MDRNFFSSRWCRSGGWCEKCRSESDPSTRQFIQITFGVHSADFDCPHGKPWGYKHELPIKKSKGLGDTIAKITKAVGIKPCKPCEERRKKLNTLFPYKRGE